MLSYNREAIRTGLITDESLITDNLVSILEFVNQISVIGAEYKELYINTIYNGEDYPKRFIIREIDDSGSIVSLLRCDFDSNHYVSDSPWGKVIIDFDWDKFIASGVKNINYSITRYNKINYQCWTLITTTDRLADMSVTINKVDGNIKNKLNSITYYDEIAHDEIIRAYPVGISGKFILGEQGYAYTALFSVSKSNEYRINGKTVGPSDVPYCSIMFTTDKESMIGTSILNTDPENIGEAIDMVYTPSENGYLFVWIRR